MSSASLPVVLIEEDEEVRRMEEPSCHPCAPSSERLVCIYIVRKFCTAECGEWSSVLEKLSIFLLLRNKKMLFDMRTTVDPSYIISLIRRLLPHNVENAHLSREGNGRYPSSEEPKIGITESTTSPISSTDFLSSPENTAEAMDTHDETSELAHINERAEDNAMSTTDEAAWEEYGCILWDLAVNKNHAVFMVENLLLEVLLANLTVSQSARVKEIGLGILANIACHEVVRNRIPSIPGLIDTIIHQLFLDDSLCLSEAFRLLSLGFQGSESTIWAKALHPEHILCRILWVVENTLNPQLLEKSMGLLLAIIDNKQEVAQILLPPLMELGLPNLIVSLLACEMKQLSGERVPERYPALDALLRVIEAVSVLDNLSEVVSSNTELFQLILDLIKLPDKVEISSSCVTAIVLIANILTDKPNLASEVCKDLIFLQGLLDLLPYTSNDIEARKALWSVLKRLLLEIQENDMNPSSLHELVAILVEKFDYIEDDLIEDLNEDPNSSRNISLGRICSVLRLWSVVREKMRKEDWVDDVVVEKLLQCCMKYNTGEV